jgi:two-component system, cell cycle sensor histidine kinase and response regulator CckA
MMQRLTAVSQRENDPLTIRRGQALALVLLLFLIVTALQGALDFAFRRDQRVAINTAIGLTLFALVYVINRSGRIRLAVLLLLGGGILAVINIAVGVGTPVPAIYYLGLVVVIAAAFGRQYDPLLWAGAVSFVPVIINLLIYSSPLAPTTTIVLPDGSKLPSLLVQEVIALSLLWMLAGTAHLASRLLNQLLDESRAATDQVIAANHSLQRSEERFSKVFHFSPVAIGIAALADGRFIDVNQHFVELTGHPHDEIVGGSTSGLDVWSDAETRASIIQTLHKHQPIRDMEATCHARDGAIRQVLFSAELIDLSGKPCALVMFYDTTQRRQVEAALRKSEERFSKVFHANSAAISITTVVEGYIVDVNDRFLRLFGYERHEAIGRTVFDLHTWANPNDRAQLVQALRERGAVLDREVIVRTRVGELRNILASFELIELDRQPCMVTLLYDITERKQAEAALRASEERYRLITEHTSDLIAIFDQVGRFVYASPSHQRTLARAPADLIGLRGIDLMHPDDTIAIRGTMARLRTEKAVQATFRYQHADGSWRWLDASMTLTTQQGDSFAISVARDVTERRRLEAQLQQVQKMEGIGRLAGGVAHDFNNLLTVMTGYGEIARENLSPADPAHEDLGELLKAAERASDLTRQLLAFARKQAIEPRILNINDLILDMGRLLRRLIGEDIELITLPAPNLGQVKVDRGQIEQVVVNLAINARDAMPDGGKLTIETKNATLDELYAQLHLEVSAGDYILLAISDTGVGMNAEVQSHLFEPFFTTKAAGKGTGLGLATCYGIIKQHSGSISVYSEVGHGTIFKIYLPCVVSATEESAQRVEIERLPRGAETVLLVEDEISVRALAARVLRAQGYAVIEAANGDEALALAHDRGEAGIDLLLTDVIMPQIGGRELAARLKALLPQVKVLYMSGYTDDAIVHHGRLEPGIVFLHKPFSPAALARKVREVLDA